MNRYLHRFPIAFALAAMAGGPLMAANTGATSCRSTDECMAQAEAVKIYAESLKDSTGTGGGAAAGPDRLPFDEAAFRNALSPAHMVRTRVGLGGPQPDEVLRMLAEAQQALDRDRDWLAQRRTQLAQAEAALNGAFESLLEPRGKR